MPLEMGPLGIAQKYFPASKHMFKVSKRKIETNVMNEFKLQN